MSKCQHPLSYISNEVHLCYRCVEAESVFYNKMISAFVYNEFIKQKLVSLQSNESFFLSDILSYFLFQKIKQLLDESCVVALIPLYGSRLLYRGYNQNWL